MRPVAIIGAGKTPFGAFPDQDLRALAVAAGDKALQNAHLEPAAIESFYLGNFAGPEFTAQNHLAPYISTALGMTGIPSTRFEAACASSGAAFFQAFMGVASGIYDVVMVAGVEKMTCQPTSRVTEILSGAGDCSTEVKAGSTFPSLFAMIARRHMHDFGTTREHLSAVAVKNHANGALNPDAQMRKVITLEQAMNARSIAEPLNLYDCSLISDGAAAVVLCAADRARESSAKPVKILGVAQASDYLALDQKPDITTFAAVRGAAKKAYGEMARRGSPADIQFAELHDCFTIAEIVAMEEPPASLRTMPRPRRIFHGGRRDAAVGGSHTDQHQPCGLEVQEVIRWGATGVARRSFAIWYSRSAAKRASGSCSGTPVGTAPRSR